MDAPLKNLNPEPVRAEKKIFESEEGGKRTADGRIPKHR